MTESDRLALAAHLHVLLRRNTGTAQTGERIVGGRASAVCHVRD